MTPDLDRIRRAEGTGPWLHEPRRQPGMTRWQYAITGAVIGALGMGLLPTAAAALIQTIGSLL